MDNGHIITANPDIMQYNQQIGEFSELHFLYTPTKNILFSAYTAVEISTLDGTMIFLNGTDTIAEAKLGICFGIVLTALILAFNVISWLCLVRVKPRKKKKKN